MEETGKRISDTNEISSWFDKTGFSIIAIG